MYVLDANVVSDFVSGLAPVVERLRRTPRAQVAICAVTLMEIEFCLRLDPRRSRRIEPAVRALLRDLEVLPYEAADAAASAEVWETLRKIGRPIGPYDIMIAGNTLRRGRTLVTGNVETFTCIPRLAVESWRK
jgi:tRNA(fMet)-specific endonuclease VapC